MTAQSLASRHNISRPSADLMASLLAADGVYSVDVYGAVNGHVDEFLVNRRDVIPATRWDIEAYLSTDSVPYGC